MPRLELALPLFKVRLDLLQRRLRRRRSAWQIHLRSLQIELLAAQRIISATLRLDPLTTNQQKHP